MSRKRPKRAGAAPPREGRVVYGVGPVSELLARRPSSITQLLVRDPPSGRLAELAASATGRKVEVVASDAAELASLAGPHTNHQGVVALAGPYHYANLDSITERASPARPVLVLDGVTDPHNLGAICRSAHLLGAAGIVVGRDRSASVNATVTKASAGATECIDIAQVTNLARALESLREAGVWRAQIAATAEARPLSSLDPTTTLALVLGSEGKGVRPLVAKQTDFAFAIPMSGRGVGSFNVSVAASLALYEIARHHAQNA